MKKNNNFNLSIPVSGLIKREDYRYDIVGLGGNWPVIALPPSGSFTATAKTRNIDTTIIFLPTTGSSHNQNYLDYDLLTCGYQTDEVFTNISAKVTSLGDGSIIQSSTQLVKCSGCVYQMGVDISGCGSQGCETTPSKITLTSSNIISITGIASGLLPNAKYHYSFTCNDSNWPSILKPISGSFIASQDGTETIVSKLMFCYPSGNCPSGTSNLLPYVLDSMAEKDFNNKKLHTNLTLSILSECGDLATSKETAIECDNCLPCVRYANIVFSGSPLITLEPGCCQGQKFMSVNVSNAIPGEKYIYNFDSIPSSGTQFLTFSPSSGEIYFGSGGYGKINTVMSTNLTDYAQTLLTVELTHTNTNIKVHDTVGLACRSDSCD